VICVSPRGDVASRSPVRVGESQERPLGVPRVTTTVRVAATPCLSPRDSRLDRQRHRSRPDGGEGGVGRLARCNSDQTPSTGFKSCGRVLARLLHGAGEVRNRAPWWRCREHSNQSVLYAAWGSWVGRLPAAPTGADLVTSGPGMPAQPVKGARDQQCRTAELRPNAICNDSARAVFSSSATTTAPAGWSGT